MKESDKKIENLSSPSEEDNDSLESMDLMQLTSMLAILKGEDQSDAMTTRLQRNILEGHIINIRSRIEEVEATERDIRKEEAAVEARHDEEIAWCEKISKGAKQVLAVAALKVKQGYVHRMYSRYKETGTCRSVGHNPSFLDAFNEKLLHCECEKRSMEGIGFTR